MVEHLQANAALVILQMRPLSGIDFGYTRESVEWLEGHIERMRQAGQFEAEATKDKLISVYGSFLGECVVRCYGGVWTQQKGIWCVAFEGGNFVYPFSKVTKQMEHGLEEGIGALFRCLPVVIKDIVYNSSPTNTA
jgi:hypothetical protein